MLPAPSYPAAHASGAPTYGTLSSSTGATRASSQIFATWRPNAVGCGTTAFQTASVADLSASNTSAPMDGRRAVRSAPAGRAAPREDAAPPA